MESIHVGETKEEAANLEVTRWFTQPTSTDFQPALDLRKDVSDCTSLLIGSLEIEVSYEAAYTSTLVEHVASSCEYVIQSVEDEVSDSFVSGDAFIGSGELAPNFGENSTCDGFVFDHSAVPTPLTLLDMKRNIPSIDMGELVKEGSKCSSEVVANGHDVDCKSAVNEKNSHNDINCSLEVKTLTWSAHQFSFDPYMEGSMMFRCGSA